MSLDEGIDPRVDSGQTGRGLGNPGFANAEILKEAFRSIHASTASDMKQSQGSWTAETPSSGGLRQFLSAATLESASQEGVDDETDEPPAGFGPDFWNKIDSRVKFAIKTVLAYLTTEGFMRMCAASRGAIALAGVGAILVMSGSDSQGASDFIEEVTSPTTAIGISVCIGLRATQGKRFESSSDFMSTWELASTIFGIFVASMSGKNAYMKYASLAKAMFHDARVLNSAVDSKIGSRMRKNYQAESERIRELMAGVHRLQFVPAKEKDEVKQYPAGLTNMIKPRPRTDADVKPIEEAGGLRRMSRSASSSSESDVPPLLSDDESEAGSQQVVADVKQAAEIVDAFTPELEREIKAKKEADDKEMEDFKVESLLPKAIAKLFDSKSESFLLKKSWFRFLIRMLVAAALAYGAAELIKGDSVWSYISLIKEKYEDGSLMEVVKKNKIYIGLATAASIAGATYFRKYVVKVFMSFFSGESLIELSIIAAMAYGIAALKMSVSSDFKLEGPSAYSTSTWKAYAKSFMASRVKAPTNGDLQKEWNEAPSEIEDFDIAAFLKDASNYVSVPAVQVEYDVLSASLKEVFMSNEDLDFNQMQVRTRKNEATGGHYLSGLSEVMSCFNDEARTKIFSFVKMMRLKKVQVNNSMKVVAGVALTVVTGALAYKGYEWFFQGKKNQKKSKDKKSVGKTANQKKQSKTDKKKAWSEKTVPKLTGESEKAYDRRIMKERFFKTHCLVEGAADEFYTRAVKEGDCLHYLFNGRGCSNENCRFKHREGAWADVCSKEEQIFDDEGKRRNRKRKRDMKSTNAGDVDDVDKSGENAGSEKSSVIHEQIIRSDEPFEIDVGERVRMCFTEEGHFAKNAILLNGKFGLTCAHAEEVNVLNDKGEMTPIKQVKLGSTGNEDIAWFANPVKKDMHQAVRYRAANAKTDERIYVLSRLNSGKLRKSPGRLNTLTGEHDANTQPGFSGSPIFSRHDDAVVAIHSGAMSSKRANVATVLTPKILGELKSLDLNRKA
jgi:hypothetical protein